MRIWPLLEQKRYLERSGHEYFTQSGKVVTQYSVRESANSQVWTHFDAILNPDGTGLQKFRYPGPAPTHIQTDPSETLFVGDCAFPNPEFRGGRNFIGVIRHVGDECEVRPLCRHDTSWYTQESHPHPIFTPDGKKVIFSSDREGKCNVYMASVSGYDFS